MHNPIGKAIISYFLMAGVNIKKLDEINQVIYISIPEDSYEYHNRFEGSPIHDAESFARRQKECLSEMLKMPNLKLKYKTYPGYWTKEDGHKNFKEKYNDYLGYF